MIAGIGTDIVQVKRFKNLSPRFMQRCFTESERAYIEGKPIASAAGLFAAKEAAVKALGTGFLGFWPCDVEITHGVDGEPSVFLHNTAREIFLKSGLLRIWISISHSESDAIAFAVAERSSN